MRIRLAKARIKAPSRKSNLPKSTQKQKAWQADQVNKSHFFHQKLHEWGLLDVQDAIDQVSGDELTWHTLEERTTLGISENAWNKVIHQGIKPVTVFAHPSVLMSLARSIGYYRMLAMVSQKSTPHAGVGTASFEVGNRLPTSEKAFKIARQLNLIICQLIETDEAIDPREFNLWRGMAAGSQAQGSWQNRKGNIGEELVRSMVRRRIEERRLADETGEEAIHFVLIDGRKIVFASDPDIAVYHKDLPVVAIEIKGGIDTAGVHERYGAIGKSFEKPRRANPECTTVLIIQSVSLTGTARESIDHNQNIGIWFTLEDILADTAKREEFLGLLGI
jgi:hypothetical protein